jgi:predicted DNA-binding transcriptional regulator AlpA
VSFPETLRGDHRRLYNMPAAEQPLLTLTEVASRTKISMPTLQRYKKLYQDRIPSVGEGRKQRYPEAALDVFEQLKTENVSRRGRPRKNAKAAPAAGAAPKKARSRKPAAKKSAEPESSGEELLTLTQISNITGVSYPTLLRYVKTNLNNIPHKGSGRARRFKPEAVEVFKDMRSRSKRGRKPKAASGKPGARVAKKAATGGRRGRPPKSADTVDLLARIKELEKSQRQLERSHAKLQKELDKPLRVVLKRS